MADLCEDGNELPAFLKAICKSNAMDKEMRMFNNPFVFDVTQAAEPLQSCKRACSKNGGDGNDDNDVNVDDYEPLGGCNTDSDVAWRGATQHFVWWYSSPIDFLYYDAHIIRRDKTIESRHVKTTSDDCLNLVASRRSHSCIVLPMLDVPRERAYRAGFMKHEGRRAAERGKAHATRGECTRNCCMRSKGEWTFPTLPEVRRSGDIQIILYTPVEISRNYDFAIKEEAPANSSSFSVIQSMSKPEQASQSSKPEFDSSVRPHLRQHPKA
ncbi:hypothetical protein ANN_22616 [Periplaneta americana]|uniref:Uncharacterized protein n=1 Tax=Periplaneta americana TaxID=6978 RepID=A0ABQ8S999_PERAM|nr:hypothetical protein ANN_22616 [Periplaneta americana]